MSQELKPCPFCGGMPSDTPTIEQIEHNSWVASINCNNCDVSMTPQYTESSLGEAVLSAIAAWNKRAQPAGEAEHSIPPIFYNGETKRNPEFKARVEKWTDEQNRKLAAAIDRTFAAPPAAANQAGIPEDVAADAARFRFLYDEMGELIWYPPGWNGNKKARFDLYWECEEQDLRKAIDEWRKRIAHTESHALGGGDE